MSIPEAPIEETPAGRVPSGPGWFVLNLIGARGFATEGHGVFCPFEAPDADFEDFGLNVHVLHPGERSALYHLENVQEGFLVLAGECVAVIEDQERTLRAWDYLHCPAGRHGARDRRRRRRAVRDPDGRRTQARGDDPLPGERSGRPPPPVDAGRGRQCPRGVRHRGLEPPERADADDLARAHDWRLMLP
jgi:mannose-6-phosphate isomerase-like protein (cupin superfamily)